MSLSRIWTIARLELTQRMRTPAWFIFLAVFAGLLVLVAWGTLSSGRVMDDSGAGGGTTYAAVSCMTLLLVMLVSPTLSGNSINGDRDAATLAPVQVTLATTGDILLGKFVAAWLTGLAFVAVSLPFLIVATLAGGVGPGMVFMSMLILVVEVGIISAIGVALSGIISRPLFSIAAAYLVVAALVVGTGIAFGLSSSALTTDVKSITRSPKVDSVTGNPVCTDGSTDCWDNPSLMVCDEWSTQIQQVSSPNKVWWMLAPNPFVILADATPTTFNSSGDAQELFGWIKVTVRRMQLAPDPVTKSDECAHTGDSSYETAKEVIDRTVPSWFVGLAVQIIAAAGLGAWAWRRTRTPTKRLPSGTRIA